MGGDVSLPGPEGADSVNLAVSPRKHTDAPSVSHARQAPTQPITCQEHKGPRLGVGKQAIIGGGLAYEQDSDYSKQLEMDWNSVSNDINSRLEKSSFTEHDST